MNQTAIGSYIARKRKEQNLTQEQLAEQLSVSNKTISKWENGKCMPDYSIIQKLCEAIHVTLPELMAGEGAADSSVRVYDDAQILDLLRRLRDDTGMAVLLITHDLGVVSETADHVVVMYCGQVVEYAPAGTIFHKNEYSHPYTEGLMLSIPRLDTPSDERLEAIPGAVPHPLDLPKCCKFAPRCKYATERCLEEEPELIHVSDTQQVRCFYAKKEDRYAK